MDKVIRSQNNINRYLEFIHLWTHLDFVYPGYSPVLSHPF